MWLPTDVEILGISDFFYYIVPIVWHFDIIIHYFFKSRKFKLLSYKKNLKIQGVFKSELRLLKWKWSRSEEYPQIYLPLETEQWQDANLCTAFHGSDLRGVDTSTLWCVTKKKKLSWLTEGAAHYFISGNGQWINYFQITISGVWKYALAHRRELETLSLQMQVHFLHFIFIFYAFRAGTQYPF